MKCRKITPIVEAHQWFKNGDHPKDYDQEKVGYENGALHTWTGAEVKALGWEGQIVRYFRRPGTPGNLACPECGSIMDHHGWIDSVYSPAETVVCPGDCETVVCPGDWIIEMQPGVFIPVPQRSFAATYEKVE